MATNQKGGSAARSSKAPAAASAAPASAPSSAPAPAPVLCGSSTLPALISIGGKDVQLGTVVAAAHAASGLTAADWNALSEGDRDERLKAQVEAMQQQADADAEAERLRLEEEARNASASGEVRYPRRLLVSNNASLSLVEPISGAYIQAGGKTHIRVTDPDHEHRVRENLAAVLAQNYLPDSSLTVEDLSD
jgi:hypothetical protein